ncbi:MAG: DUF4091 domain-containing protein [Bacteroidales bacterium]|nr:DUF4091 domain-containing protein [Bacteroidales bacterium]
MGTSPDIAIWNTIPDGLQASWASRDVHYALHEVPVVELQNEAILYAWKGERANIQAVLFSKTDQGQLSVRMSEWMRAGQPTGINNGFARFVNYVITDDFKACGNHPSGLTTWLVPDVIDQDKPHSVPAMETRPVWCTLEIPRDAEAGEYNTQLEVVDKNGEVVKTLTLKVLIDNHLLPEVADQKFHLDLWQQPYAVSRYYGVQRWSDEHIQILKPYLQALARAGQCTVTAILFYEPWGEQTHDLFDPMIQTIRCSDGTWSYDYTVFDKYVALCEECGIGKQINCFSMVPWDMNFRYWDEASGAYKYLKTTTGASEYKDLWNSFLTAFKAHLQEKGWFEKTNIAMDERAEADMLDAYNIANQLGFNMALAGNYHASLTDKLQDFCVALGQDKNFTAAQRADRRNNHRITTFYTSCAEAEPNIFSNSLPAEAAFLPLYAAANQLDGYLHWSWINWDEHPLTDSRYRKFGSGDTYCYYPGNRSSIRFERLIEGIHQYEKVMILKEEYQSDTDRLATLNRLLERFSSHLATGEECAEKVNDLEAFLNGQEVQLSELKTIGNGYYRIVSKAKNRTEHLYNNALLGANDMQFTLQSDSQVSTNNGVWRIDLNDNKVSILNGDGHPMVAGSSGGGSVAGIFRQLTISKTMDVDDYRYYYFVEAINCTNGSSKFKVGGTDFITTWTAGASTADDLLWRFEPVDTEGKYIYNVCIEGDADAYVIYSHDGIEEVAFHGGFFITDSPITTQDLSYALLNGVIETGSVSITDGLITLSEITAMAAPQRIDLFNTSQGDGVIPPYRIPGISTASNGRLIAVAARLVCGTDPGYGQVDVVCRSSDDNGTTWTPIREVAVGTGITSATENFFDTAFGDPAVVADRTSNEILVLAVAGCTVWSSGNTTRQNPNLIAAIRSMDNGDTWQAPVDLTETIYSLFDCSIPLQAAFVGGGRVFQSRLVKTGQYYRLYAALNARPGGNRVIYSDDFGRSWHVLGGADALPAPNGDEPKCEELPDGRVILSSRVAGGRIFNIFTYDDTLLGIGSWDTDVKCTFEGSGLIPGNNSTNGEILVVPVVRKADQSEMYLAMQSMPSGNSRTNVGIYYKELSENSDFDSATHFASGWDGFHQVSSTVSAYSSMDLQADDRVGFIYEETLTSFGKRDNPVSTSFPTGAGQHNFDGFDNIYLALPIEYITGGDYSLKRDVDRKDFLKRYFLALADASSLSEPAKVQLKNAIMMLSSQPSSAEIDAIYTLLHSEKPADPWDGKVITFTNLQQDGTEYVLFINDSNILSAATATAQSLGAAAEFLCKKEQSGRYSFYNKASEQYIIWRASDTQRYGYNNNKGTLPTYNSIYCDWTISSGSSVKDDSYYLISKRSNGSTDGSLIIMASGNFDAWSADIGWSNRYSNLFRIDVKTIPVSVTNFHYAQPEMTSYKVFDLSGRQVVKPQKGIYIVRGKAVMFSQ